MKRNLESFITRTKSLQLSNMRGTLEAQQKEGLKPRAKTHNIVVGLLLHKPRVMVPSFGKIIGPFWNTINPTSFSYQSHPKWNLNDTARVGKRAWIFYVTEKCSPGNHHVKGWHAPRLPISQENPGWRKNCSSSNNANEDDEQHGTVEDEVAEFKISVWVKLLWKKKAIEGICKLLEISIF